MGYNEKYPDTINIDIEEEKFPFSDKEIDFIYCRHVIEDLTNPIFTLKEIFRTSKYSYIETPSPLAEITKGIDNYGQNSQNYYGYIHHNYIVWSNIKKNTIYLLPKNVNIIHNFINSNSLNIYQLLKNPFAWNNYFFSNNFSKPNIIIYKNINIPSDNYINFYIEILNNAIKESIDNSNYFMQTIF